MLYKIIDTVTADCLEVGDIVSLFNDAIDDYSYVVITEILDEGDTITVLGHDAEDDETEFDVPFDPERGLNLYMEDDNEPESV
jgi:hypothetical protein